MTTASLASRVAKLEGGDGGGRRLLVFKCEHTTGPDLWHNESGRCIEVTLGANKWHVLPEDVAALKAFRRNHRVRANDYFAVLPRDMTRDEWMAWMHQGIVPGPLLTFVP